MNRILAALGAVLLAASAVFSFPVSAAVLGEQHAIILNVCFSDYCPQAWTPQQMQDRVNVDANNFYDEVANPDNTLLNPPFLSAVSNPTNPPSTPTWWILPILRADCATGVLDYAIQAAANRGIDATSYAYIVLAYPDRPCAGEIGRGTYGKRTGFPYAVTWLPKTSLPQLNATVHELGHNFRNPHAHSIDCCSIPSTILISTPTANDSGWWADIMGTGPGGHFNAYAKWYMGWSDPQIVTASGAYTIQPTETTSDALAILRYTDPTTGQRQWIMAERRQAIGYDAALNTFSNNYLTGVVLSIGQESAPNTEGIIYEDWEIDLTPGDNQRANGALQVGQCWQDIVSGISIEVQSSTPGGAATVYVSMIGGCEPPPPPPSNNPPIANPDAATMPWNSTAPITIPVLANDSDPDGDPLTIINVTQGGKGSTTIVAGAIRYTPNKPMRGSDSFSYTISDGQGGTDSASVTVTAMH